MFSNYFPEIWKLFPKVLNGVLFHDIEDLGYAELITSPVPGEYFNFAVPTVTDYSKLDIAQLRKKLLDQKQKLCIYLLEEHQKAGFVEYLIRQGLKFEGRDSWMGYDKSTYINSTIKSSVTLVTINNFDDYKYVSEQVFSDFPGNDVYIKICRKTLEKVFSPTHDLISKMYLIYEGNKPVANGGLFYSVKENFAYLHDAGTLEQYRGKGYQSDLIKYRVNEAVANGIDRIFASVDHGGKSWSNTIKCGLNNLHTGMMFVDKN